MQAHFEACDRLLVAAIRPVSCYSARAYMPPIYITINSAQNFAYLLRVCLVTLPLALAHIAWTLGIVTSSKRDIILHHGHCRYCTVRARWGARDTH
jgi:hypothetical protein